MTELPRPGRMSPHIMHVSQPVEGGTAAVVEQLAAGDLARGFTVSIVSPKGRLEEWARKHGARWTELPLTRRPASSDVNAVRSLRRLFGNVDVTYLHSSKAGAVGRIALATLPKVQRPRCIFIPHAWSWYVGGPAAPAYKWFEQLASHWAEAIVAVSAPEAADGRRVLLAGGAARVVLIENGVDVTRFAPEGSTIDKGTGPMIVCVGRLCEQKGQDVLIRSLALLDDRSVHLTLVGEGPDRSALRALAMSLNVTQRVHFAGHADPRPYYRAADVVVLPSRWEGLSLVLLEAMACGSAILASDAGASGLEVGDGIVIIDGTEPERLASSLTNALQDDELRNRLAARARRVAVDRYSSALTLQRHRDLVDSLVASRMPGSEPTESAVA